MEQIEKPPMCVYEEPQVLTPFTRLLLLLAFLLVMSAIMSCERIQIPCNVPTLTYSNHLGWRDSTNLALYEYDDRVVCSATQFLIDHRDDPPQSLVFTLNKQERLAEAFWIVIRCNESTCVVRQQREILNGWLNNNGFCLDSNFPACDYMVGDTVYIKANN